jgi:hypothetical protein
MQFWRSRTDDREVVVLFKSPTRLDANQFFGNDRMHDTLQDARIVARRQIEICGGQAALYVQAEGTSAKGGRERVDAVTSNVGGSTYFAMYVRPLGALPNPAALAALHELCRKP